jgi:hypothetical protein
VGSSGEAAGSSTHEPLLVIASTSKVSGDLQVKQLVASSSQVRQLESQSPQAGITELSKNFNESEVSHSKQTEFWVKWKLLAASQVTQEDEFSHSKHPLTQEVHNSSPPGVSIKLPNGSQKLHWAPEACKA